ncbi:rod shape-determining protein MreC [Oenococcus alcoholitolerans]|uniref:rod shape-determining protein MreC n=1 Tax=Oenococcus alcoholitolerans TaxID=931074 RepID=UPI003F709974
MKFNGKKILISIITLVVALGLIIGSSLFYRRASRVPIVQRFINDMGSFVARGISAPVNALGRSANTLGQLFDTYQENQRLMKRVDQIASDQIRIQNLQKENKELKANLRLKNSLTDYQTVSAVVISRSPSNWNSELVINRGSSSGISKNSPILDSRGLIGLISQVNNNSSKVTLISNNNADSSRFPVQVNSGSDSVNGIISGYQSNGNRLIMDQLNNSADIKKGSLVQTSGLGGILPKGLYVGRVIGTHNDADGSARQIYIRPASDLRDISSVLVVTGVGGR